MRRFVSGSLVRAYRYSLPEMLGHYYRKHRAAVNVAVACVILLIAVGAYSYVSILHAWNREYAQRQIAESAREQEAQAREDAEKKTYLSDLRLVQAYLQEGDSTRADEVLWRMQESRRGWEWGYLLNRANAAAVRVDVGAGLVYGCLFSPNGRQIVTVSTSKPPQLWDADTGQEIMSFEGGPVSCMSCRFNSGGERFIVGAPEGNVIVWDTATGELVRKLHAGVSVYDVCIDRTGSRAFAGCVDGVVRVWDVDSGEVIGELAGESGAVWRIQLLPTEDRLAGECGSGLTRVWDLVTRAVLYTVPGRLGALSPKASLLATEDGKDIRLWNAETGAELCRLVGDGQEVYTVEFSQSGLQLVSTSLDNSVRLWDAVTGKRISDFRCNAPMNFACFVEEDRFVLGCDVRNHLTLWDSRGQFKLYSLSAGKPETLAASTKPSLAPDTRRLAFAAGNSEFQVWNLVAPTGMQILDVPQVVPGPAQGSIRDGASLSPRGDLLAMWCNTPGVTVHSIERGGSVARFQPPFPFLRSLGAKFSSDGELMAAILDGATVSVWELDDTSIVSTHAEHAGAVTSVDFSPDGERVVSGSWDTTARVWNARTGDTALVLDGHSDTICDVKYSPDGQAILTVSADKTAVLWSSETGQKLLSFAGHQSLVSSGAFSVDGRRVVTLGTEGIAHVWEAQSGTILASLQAGRAGASTIGGSQSVAFGWKDQFIETSSFESPTRIWDGVSYEPLIGLDIDEIICFLPDECSIIAVDRAGTIRREEAAPWRADKQAGFPGDTWEERYRNYRQAKSRAAIPSPPSETDIVIPIGTETLVAGLSALLSVIQDDTGDTRGAFESGLLITPGARTSAVADIALAQDDCITHANGHPLGSRSDVLSRLEDACKGLSSLGQTPSPNLAVRRRGRAVNIRYRVLPVQHVEVRVPLPRKVAISLLAQEISDLPGIRLQPEHALHCGWACLPIAIDWPREILEPCALGAWDVRCPVGWPAIRRL